VGNYVTFLRLGLAFAGFHLINPLMHVKHYNPFKLKTGSTIGKYKTCRKASHCRFAF